MAKHLGGHPVIVYNLTLARLVGAVLSGAKLQSDD